MAARRRARRSTALAPRRTRSSGTFRRVQRSSGPSPAAVKQRARTRMLALGGGSAALFGFIQSKMNLPGINGVPDSLTYGAAGLAVGIIAGSELLMNVSTGPFFAGLHNVALHGLGSTAVGGEFDEFAAGEDDESAGEFDDVAAGDFDDL